MANNTTTILTPFLSSAGADPATQNDATALNALGQIYVSNASTTGVNAGLAPKVWQYVQLHASSAVSAAGTYFIWQDYDNFVVTTVNSTTSANRNAGAGCSQAAGTVAGNFGWIQVGGQGLVLLETATAGAVGQHIIAGATTAGRADSIALGTAPTSGPYGRLLTVEIGTSDTYEAHLFFPPLGR